MHCLLNFVGLESMCNLKLILTQRNRSTLALQLGGSRPHRLMKTTIRYFIETPMFNVIGNSQP